MCVSTRNARFVTIAGGLGALAALGLSAPAVSQEGPEISANIAFVTDYRFRGISLSDESFAIQGGFDAALASGLYAGTWASSIEELAGSETELDAYAGYAGAFGDFFEFDVGVLGYFYPGGDDLAYGEIYGSIAKQVGAFALGGGIAYAPEQDNIGEEDNTYVYITADTPLGESGFSIATSLGWEDGAFGDEKIDWLIGISTEWQGLEWGLSYIDTSEDFEGAEGTAVFSIAKSL